MGERKLKGASPFGSAELPAGRELDGLVAERVMGWRKHRVAPYPPSESQADKVWRPPYSDHAYCLPDYSTDIAAAWKVVEKMGDRLDLIYPAWDINDSGVRLMHWVVVTQHGYGIIDGRRGHVADTAPLAICRAALRAVGTSGEVPADSALVPPPPGSPRTET